MNIEDKLITNPVGRGDFASITKADLFEGSILPIYENWKNQENLMGLAKLNYLVEAPDHPYERATIGAGKVNEPNMVIFKYEKWNITFIDPTGLIELPPKELWTLRSQQGFTTNWNISYFETIDSNYVS